MAVTPLTIVSPAKITSLNLSSGVIACPKVMPDMRNKNCPMPAIKPIINNVIMLCVNTYKIMAVKAITEELLNNLSSLSNFNNFPQQKYRKEKNIDIMN